MKFTKRFCALLLMLTMLISAVPFISLTALALEGEGAPTDLTYYAKGVDISYWQAGDSTGKNVDFAKLKASGCEFVILRLAYGQSMDKAFLSFYNNARAAGMPLGVYIYGLKTTYAGAASDAQWAIDIFEKYDMYFEYPIFYDIEEKSQLALSSANATALCQGWCETLRAAGYYPGIYSGKQFYNLLSSSFKAQHDLWIAHVASTDVTAWQFTYNYKDYNAQGYSMWQYAWSNLSNGSYIYDGIYSSGTTKVKDLDIDVCYKNYPEIMKANGYNNCGTDAKPALLSAIEKAKEERYTKYGSGELATFRAAYDNAVKVYNSSSSTDAQYQAAKTDLENAMVTGTVNLSKGKSYTATNAWTFEVDGATVVDDGVKLTDGDKGNADGWTKKFFGAKGTEVVVDLGSSQYSNIYKIYMTSGVNGIATPWGDQLSMTISVSDDKVNYTEVVTANDCVHGGGEGEWRCVTLDASVAASVSGRYVKFDIKSTATNNYVWIDEVEVSRGEVPLSGNVYVNGINEKIGAGDCHIFTPSFGEITVDNANHNWTFNGIAKWDAEQNGYIIQEPGVVSANGGAQSITLADDEILIAAHNWETGVSDGTQVAGSAVNTAVFGSFTAGTVIELNGIDAANNYLSAAAYITVKSSDSVTDEETNPENPEEPAPDHVHTPGEEPGCVRDQYCLDCNEVLKEAVGHIESDWQVVDGENIQVIRCTVCGYVLRAMRIPTDSGLVEEPDTSEPVEDETSEPIEDETSEPVEEETSEPIEDVTSEPAEDETSEPVDEETSEPVDETSEPVDDENSDPDDGNGPEEIGLRGDINDNGEVDSLDYILLKRAYFGTYLLDERATLCADINEDEAIESLDYILLKRAFFNTYVIKNPYVYK